ncbi:hypothetical protein [Bombella mellum]|uniref:Apea-like HEPN domain-containing protein n=1 Tax=Bombella mellum TaxID=2039288 RepID=A0ABR5ZQH9_9PROT|nr:hypothetical protein [Bombella mellum]MBA5726553.1 hypothetical protein [Bombella mellum]
MTHHNQMIKPIDEIRKAITSLVQSLHKFLIGHDDQGLPYFKDKETEKEIEETKKEIEETYECLGIKIYKDEIDKDEIDEIYKPDEIDTEAVTSSFDDLFDPKAEGPQGDFDKLEKNLKELHKKAGNPDVLDFNKISLILKLIREIKLSSALKSIPTTDLNQFKLYEEDRLNTGNGLTFYNSADDSEENYYVYDGDDKKNSFVFMSISSSGRLEINDTERTAPRTPILLYTILLICRRNEPIRQGKWLVSNIADPKNRLSYVKYHMLLKGYYLNKLAPSIINKHPNIEKILDSSKDYAQFHELFEIMSEINSRKTVLDKFMSCYHALENYMLRTKIVAIISNNDGHLFGVRQFKHLGLQVEEKELKDLNELFKISSNRIVNGENQDLKNSIKEKWESFWSRVPRGYKRAYEDAINELIKKISPDGKGFTINFNTFNGFYDNLPKIIYRMRCSIVHNKATEYHLSSREMADPIKKEFIEGLCIPCMEMLAFGLPASTQGQGKRDKHPLKYTKRSIPLY